MALKCRNRWPNNIVLPRMARHSAPLESLIRTVRGCKVLLDADLAEIYEVPTKRLNEQVKRNADRFPDDFVFRLTAEEWRTLRLPGKSEEPEHIRSEALALNWSQIATSSGRRRGAVYRPYAFTEHGAIMAATVLNSPQAVKMSVFVVRAFVQMREQLAANAAILKRLAEIDKTLLAHDQTLQAIWQQLEPLLQPPPEPPRRRIGFKPDSET
jgi:ORF6N domain